MYTPAGGPVPGLIHEPRSVTSDVQAMGVLNIEFLRSLNLMDVQFICQKRALCTSNGQAVYSLLKTRESFNKLLLKHQQLKTEIYLYYAKSSVWISKMTYLFNK